MAMERYSFNKEDEASLTKRKSSLEAVDGSKNGLSGGFDCNICLDIVQDPVVTLCGHLYCWPCIYKWIHHQRTSSDYQDKQSQQCPVCKTNVSQKTVVPIYGRGQIKKPDSQEKADHDLGLVIPRRPPSPRYGFDGTIPAQEPNYQGYQQRAPPPLPMLSRGDSAMTSVISPISPTAAMFGEMVYGGILGNSEISLYTHPNSYNLAGISTRRTRRQAMQADSLLKRIYFFFLCCLTICLILF